MKSLLSMTKVVVLASAVSLMLMLTSAFGADRGPINSGETKIGFEISAPSYIDTWTFEGEEADRVLISVETTSGALSPYIELYPPGGGPREAYSSPGSIDHQLEQTGTYSIVISDFGYDDESATDVLTYVASIFARGDAKDGS